MYREQKILEYHKTAARKEQLKDLKYLARIDENTKNIRTEPQGQILWKSQSSFPTTLDPPPKMSEATNRIGTIKNGAEPYIFPLKANIFYDAPCI